MFNQLKSRKDLAQLLGVSHNTLTYLLYEKKIENCYIPFAIPKKSGGIRRIDAPREELKFIQKKLAEQLQKYREKCWQKKHISPNISHGFEVNKSIITNAMIHKNKRYVLNLDLNDFFGTIHFGRVSGFFQKNRDFMLPYEVSIIISQLTCYKGKLPQGAPTSPVIANLICQILDFHLLSLAKKYKLDYTRYADDLTFSTNKKDFLDIKDSFFQKLEKKINQSGFSINEKKTRINFRQSRQEVTGLVVNKKINVKKEFIKDTRAMAHQLYQTGSFTINGKPGTLSMLEGRFSFINQIDNYNNTIDNLQKRKHKPQNLNSREHQYKIFLFYKYFFANNMPIIITEGKTDIRYIKAALKKEYKSYPSLVEKSNDDKFSFKISFLRRSKRWKDLFNLSKDGADSISGLYKYFDKNNKKENLMR